ncbi:winged helix DNA-binding domain-containing protein [Streptomyces sp. NBC_01257]|uniref:winged helix DNA-binding domain-containing protein n=1 Tax=Streptomyces sp. NBC_01257 TaxID=2903799 RepID=UPI002DD85EED|nr:winged helix DNA-binding domain-containing protein [Streptomyces sp. NBC_01257]WRZ67020.1 winged helix DNA-binding domain-containing protein [Streptomyces sp. NBC_01257]
MTRRTPTAARSGANTRRMERQGLAVPLAAAPAGIVESMPAAHAQVLSAAELSVGLRSRELTRADVRKALWTDRTLVKTFGPRGTVHLVSAAELDLWTGALSALPVGRSAHPEGVRMTPEQTEEVLAAIGEALTGAELTVDELTDAVVARAGAWAGEPVVPAFQTLWPRWRQVTHLASHRGLLSFGQDRGRKVTYTRPDVTPLDGPAALTALVRRYLYAYGPATAQHFARWLAVSPRWAAGLFAHLAADGTIEEVTDEDGGTAWVTTGDTAFPARPVHGVRLLPYFDAFVIASQPREKLFPGAAYTRALAGGQAGNFPVLLIDGTVAGVWHQRRSGRRIAVTVEPLAPMTAGQLQELEQQVARVGEVLEGKPELTVGKVTVGGHA